MTRVTVPRPADRLSPGDAALVIAALSLASWAVVLLPWLMGWL